MRHHLFTVGLSALGIEQHRLTTSPSFSIQPLTILGVTGPFSVLAENIYSLCEDVFKVISREEKKEVLAVAYDYPIDTILTVYGLVSDPFGLASLRPGYS